MRPATRTPIPRGTNQNPWVAPVPFNPAAPFATGTLGVIMAASATTPAASLYRYLISSGDYRGTESDHTAGSLMPIANPTNLATGSVWYDGHLDAADMLLIRPFFVIYDNATPTALAAAAVAQALTAEMSFWLVRHVGAPKKNRKVEYTADYKGKVTITNAATRIDSATMELPTGAQWADAGTVDADFAIDPGLVMEQEIATGALRLRFDQEGAIGYICKLSDVTASAGVGWLRTQI